MWLDKMPRVMKVRAGEIFVGLIVVLWFGLPPNVLGYMSGSNNKEAEQHAFRHRQHYNNNHRIEQAVNDYRSSQMDRMNTTSHVYLRHHNHHHEHQHASGPQAAVFVFHPSSTSPPPPPPTARHHLRHYNRHHQTWEQRVFPSLRHQTTSSPLRSGHPSIRYNFTSNTEQGHYLDRGSIYARKEITTQGPKLSNSYGNSGKPMVHGQRRDKLISVGSMDSLDFLSDEEESMLNDETKPKPKQKLKQEDNKANLDDYYEDDDNSIESDDEDEDDTNDADAENDDDDNDDDDDDYSDEEDSSAYDETTNKVDERNLPKRRTKEDFDTEDIYSRSYIPGTLTRYKYEMFGTHEAVERSRTSHITNQKQHRALANAHATKVYMEATCKYPKPRVERIQKDPSKVYVPHCTILHRCADDTGCCSADSHTCVAKRTQSVDLYFFVKTFGSKQGTVEKHTFINHTECHCVDRAKHSKYPQAPAMLRQATILDCTCPKLFEKVLQEDGFCRCDCSSSNSGCDWVKRGMEHFSVADRKCITEGRCKPPTCEFGTYIKKHGRCPRKDDKMNYSRGFL